MVPALPNKSEKAPPYSLVADCPVWPSPRPKAIAPVTPPPFSIACFCISADVLSVFLLYSCLANSEIFLSPITMASNWRFTCSDRILVISRSPMSPPFFWILFKKDEARTLEASMTIFPMTILKFIKRAIIKNVGRSFLLI